MKKEKNSYHLCLKTGRSHIHKFFSMHRQSVVVLGLHLGRGCVMTGRKVIYFLLIYFLRDF